MIDDFMKRKLQIYFRSLYLSSVIILCLTVGLVGIAKAYENTLQTGFGQYQRAIEYRDGILRILDFKIIFN